MVRPIGCLRPSGNVYLPGHPSHQPRHRPQTPVQKVLGILRMHTAVGGSSGTAWSRPVWSRNVTGCWSRPLLIRLTGLYATTGLPPSRWRRTRMGDLGGRAPPARSRGLRLPARRVRVVVLVVAAHPELRRIPLVAAERGAVEEAVVADHELEPAGGGGVGQVDGSVLERVGAHHGRLGKVGRGLGSAFLRELGGDRGDAAGQELAGGLLRARDLEVEVVIACV